MARRLEAGMEMAPPPGRPLKLLMVEDSEDDAELVRLHLEEGGVPAAITRAGNRKELGRCLEETDWDLVICDHHLPDLDSLLALEMVRRKQAALPFFVVSGSIPGDLVEEVLRRGARHFVSKRCLEKLPPAIMGELGLKKGGC